MNFEKKKKKKLFLYEKINVKEFIKGPLQINFRKKFI